MCCHRYAISLACTILLLVTSCGYHLTPVGGVVPEHAKSISIPVFLNATSEPTIDTSVTQAVVEEFLSDGRLKLASIEAADVIMRGRVLRFELVPLSYNVDAYVQQYSVKIVLDVSVENAKTHATLWQERELSTVFITSYPVTIGDVRATRLAKDDAVGRACRDVASTLRSRILEGF